MSHSKLQKKMMLLGGAAILALGLSIWGVVGCASQSSTQAAQEAPTTTTTQSSEAQSPLLNTITVSGSGQVSALPDQAVINLGVEGNAATAAAALDANSKQTQKVLARLKADGVPDAAIETTNVAVYPNSVYDQKTGMQTTTTYQATNTVNVTLTDVTLIGSVMAAAAEAGATTISGPTWQLSDSTKAESEALTKAATQAQAKAEALAAAQGVTLGEVLVLSEASTSPPVYYYAPAALAATTTTVAAPPINPQNLDITASVTITYRLKR
jgi:uncharacterized protein YggE